MTAPSLTAVTTFVDETPNANSQATGTIAHSPDRLYLITVTSSLGSSVDPPVATLSGWNTTWTSCIDNLWRASGTNRARTQMFWGLVAESATTALTVTYTGVTLLALDVLVDYATGHDTTSPVVDSNEQNSGEQSKGAGTTTSFITFNSLDHADNRTFVIGTINGNDTTLDFDTGHTNLSTLGSGTAPTRRTITGWLNNATPDLTPSITSTSAWTCGMAGIEVRGFQASTSRKTWGRILPRGNTIISNRY
jgi:hypothetical protein